MFKFFIYIRCSFWPKCLDLKEECDYSTQKCAEPRDPSQEASCQCLDGFEEVENSNDKKCEKKDICKHKKPCGTDPNMKCYNTKSDFECVCRNGFYKSKYKGHHNNF